MASPHRPRRWGQRCAWLGHCVVVLTAARLELLSGQRTPVGHTELEVAVEYHAPPAAETDMKGGVCRGGTLQMCSAKIFWRRQRV
ncbi:hypothetical protein DFH06DRAFT_1174015 [Mycena polygramma]|nr:hypothetical protein DFH06DRAFT_1174015 [Mycena polygramma]